MARADKFSQVARKREFLREQKAQQTQLLNRNIGKENGVKSDRFQGSGYNLKIPSDDAIHIPLNHSEHI